MFYIGNVKIENPIIAAPMAGVTNLAFREILKEYGVGLVVTEMVSDKALVHHNTKTIKMLQISKMEHPVSIQLFGSNIDTMVEAAKILDKSEADIIDINMGCPVKKIIKSGAGAKLLTDTSKAFEIVRKITNTVVKPVTVKIRTGWDSNSINAVEFAKLMEKAGASAVFIHGRTRSQFYSGKCDLQIIKAVKSALSIPVIGNGDITCVEDALIMKNETNVDGIMIGRGLLGNPWLVKQILHSNKLIFEPDYSQFVHRKPVIIKHLHKLINLKGDKIAVLEMRSHIGWYVKGLKHCTMLRRKLNEVSTITDIIDLLEEYEASKGETNV